MELIFNCARVVDFSFRSSHFIYNNPVHLVTQSKSGWWHYTAAAGKSILAEIYFNTRLKVATSPYRAPFSGFEYKRELSQKQLASFVHYILEDFKKKRINELQIRTPPELLDEKLSKRVHQTLTQFGFKCVEEVSSIVRVDQHTLCAKMNPAKRNRLRKSAVHLQFKSLPLNRLKEAYDFLMACRKERDQSLSMPYSSMQKLQTVLPQNLFLYCVYHANEMAAVAIVIKVSDSVLYTFYYGHLKKFDKLSPIPFLLDELYAIAKKEDFKWIDLGTSMLNGSINRPLLHFKKSIGATATVKRSYLKVL